MSMVEVESTRRFDDDPQEITCLPAEPPAVRKKQEFRQKLYTECTLLYAVRAVAEIDIRNGFVTFVEPGSEELRSVPGQGAAL